MSDFQKISHSILSSETHLSSHCITSQLAEMQERISQLTQKVYKHTSTRHFHLLEDALLSTTKNSHTLGRKAWTVLALGLATGVCQGVATGVSQTAHPTLHGILNGASAIGPHAIQTSSTLFDARKTELDGEIAALQSLQQQAASTLETPQREREKGENFIHAAFQAEQPRN